MTQSGYAIKAYNMQKNRASKYLKSKTVDFNKTWKNSFADKRAEILKSVGISQDMQISELVNLPYVDLPVDIRFNLETRTQ